MLQNVSIISFASFIIFSSHLILQNLFFNMDYRSTIGLVNEIEKRCKKSKTIDYFVAKGRLFIDGSVILERTLGIQSNSTGIGRPTK